MKTAPEARKHHYVPQWYLRRFGTKKEIGVYDKWTGAFDVLRPKDVAFNEGLYDIDNPALPRSAAETLLSNIESCAASVFRVLASTGLENLTPEQREDIAAFVAAQQLRVPSYRKALVQLIRTKLDHVRAGLSDKEIRAFAQGTALTGDEIELIRGAQLGSSVPSGVVGGGLIIALRGFVDELLTDYRWSVLAFDNAALITSDTPVKAMTEKDDDGAKSVFVDFPFDPSHVLLLQTGSGGSATASLGGVDDWYRDENGLPSLKRFQNLNFMKGNRFVFGHPANPIWAELGVGR